MLSTSEKSGGANKSLLELLKHLDRKKIDPFVLMRRHGDIEDELKLLNIPVTIIPFINSVTTGNLIKDFAKKLSYKYVIPKIKKYYKKNRIELVHNNSIPALAGMEAAYELGIPYVCHIREDVEKGLGVNFLNKQHHLNIANLAAKKIAISNFVKKSYIGYLENVEVIYDGLDTNAYYEEKEILDKTPIVISMYGNLDEQKGQLIAVKALEYLQNKGNTDFRLSIVGNQNTDYGVKVKRYVIEKQIKNIQFVETITSFEKLREHRLNDDINLVCSNAEGLGRVTIESMLAGCLTIGASAGATVEIINDGQNGLLFNPDDVNELVGILLMVKNNTNEAARIAKHGQNYALANFDVNKYVTEISMIYRKALVS